jgi:hypothetical protein
MKIWQIIWILGIIGLLSYFFFFSISIALMGGYMGDPESGDSVMGELTIFVCTPTVLVPSIFLTFFGFRGRKKYKELTEIAKYMEAYRKITITELSLKIGKSVQETEDLVKECYNKKLLDGYFDSHRSIYYSQEGYRQLKKSMRGFECPNCGGYNDQVFLPGEAAKCGYCGKIMSISKKKNTKDLEAATPQPQTSPPVASSPQIIHPVRFSVPPGSTPTPQHQLGSTTCRYCRGPLNYISQYGRWYCNYCRQYA